MAQDPAAPAPSTHHRQGAITARAIILGLLLMPPNFYWCLKVEGI